MHISALYAGLLGFIFLVLVFRVINVRKAIGVPLGDGGDDRLIRLIRSHGNFAEYAPMALVLMGLAESVKTPGIVLHAVGVAFVVGRITHAYGLSQSPENFKNRIAGMMMTVLPIAVIAVCCLVGALGVWS